MCTYFFLRQVHNILPIICFTVVLLPICPKCGLSGAGGGHLPVRPRSPIMPNQQTQLPAPDFQRSESAPLTSTANPPN